MTNPILSRFLAVMLWTAAAGILLTYSIIGVPGHAQPQRTGAPNGSAAYQQPLRPQFHWSPRTDFTNDPNGLVYYAGEYHLFNQGRDFSDIGNPYWGHAVSTDLVHWKQLPIAIPKVPGVLDGMGQRICSGSAVVDWNNTSGFGTANNPPMVAAYTDPCIDGIKAWQAQSIAYSLDKGRTWTKYSGNPVIDIKARGFRDLKVIWHEPTKRWIAPMAYPDRGVVAIYASPNLREWTHISESGGSEWRIQWNRGHHRNGRGILGATQRCSHSVGAFPEPGQRHHPGLAPDPKPRGWCGRSIPRKRHHPERAAAKRARH